MPWLVRDRISLARCANIECSKSHAASLTYCSPLIEACSRLASIDLVSSVILMEQPSPQCMKFRFELLTRLPSVVFFVFVLVTIIRCWLMVHFHAPGGALFFILMAHSSVDGNAFTFGRNSRYGSLGIGSAEESCYAVPQRLRLPELLLPHGNVRFPFDSCYFSRLLTGFICLLTPKEP